MVTIPASHRSLLDSPVGVLATVGPAGAPQTTAVWFVWDDAVGAVRFSLSTARQKVKNLQAHPQASFLVIDLANPYRTIELRGPVEITPDPDYAFADRLGAKYGEDLRKRDHPGDLRVAISLRPRKVLTWGD